MNSDIFNNPLFQNLSPEKLKFLMEFQSMQKPTDTKNAAPFFMNTMNQAKQQGIQFSREESSVLIQLLMQNMPEVERKKAEMLLRMMRG